METSPSDFRRHDPRAFVGKGVLVQLLTAYGSEAAGEGLDHLARLCGFVAAQAAPAPLAPRFPAPEFPEPPGTPAAGIASQETAAQAREARFVRVVEYSRIKEKDQKLTKPKDLEVSQPLADADFLAPPGGRNPKKIPLMPWSRLDRFLSRALSRKGRAKAVDVRSTIRHLSLGHTLRELPRKQLRGWAPRATLLVDRASYLMPFWDDQMVLLRRLARQRGRFGLRTMILPGGPQGSAWDYWHKRAVPKPLGSIERGEPVLLLGDCGFLYGQPAIQSAWREAGQMLRRHCCRPVALAPCPRDRWPAKTDNGWRIACWDRNERLPTLDDSPPGGSTYANYWAGSEDDVRRKRDEAALALLRLLSPTVSISPPLLREARLLLSADSANVGTEADAWNHNYIAITSPSAVTIESGRLQEMRSRTAQAGLPLREQNGHSSALRAMLETHHAHRSPMVQLEERLNLLQVAPDVVDRATLVAELLQVAGTLLEPGRLNPVRAHWVLRMIDRLGPELRALTSGSDTKPLAAAYWAAAGMISPELHTTPLPEGFTESDISWLRGGETVRATVWQYAQDGKVVFDLINPNYGLAAGASRLGSRIFEVNTRTGTLRIESRLTEGKPRAERIQQVPANLNNVYLDLTFPTKVSNEWEAWHLEEITRPVWASAIGRDRYGLWADLEVKGVVQRMRWVNPGTFLMGSTDDEPGHQSNEWRHRVTHTDGYWLGDTPCTHEFWRAVMEAESPSHFKIDSHPVERVTWSEAVEFTGRLPMPDDPSWRWALPTEAQWEYACRAGTASAIYTGTLHPNGGIPPAGLNSIAWHEGNSEGTTHPVKQKQCNDWGLFDTLGNVWEWCADWYARDIFGPEENPTGPDQGLDHVVRGGGWKSASELCRSAKRTHAMEGDSARDYNIGFRIAMARRKESLPPHPAWASAIGRDKYGLWADLEVAGVLQRMRWINPGSFLMGSPEDEPGRFDREKRHQVTLTKGYWLADTPCTQAFWLAVMGGKNPARFQSPDRPVEQVSWHDCQEFLKRLPGLEEAGMRWGLPTEAQWEYACRAGTETALYTGGIEILGDSNAPALDAIAWYGGNSGCFFELENGHDCSGWPERQYPEPKKAGTHPVKRKAENRWGLYDMIGNLWEWCADWYGDYGADEAVNPTGPDRGDFRVFRGGCWSGPALYCRSASRYRVVPDDRGSDLGFRFAQVGGAEETGQGVGRWDVVSGANPERSESPVGTRGRGAVSVPPKAAHDKPGKGKKRK